jgi:hypothetical protein
MASLLARIIGAVRLSAGLGYGRESGEVEITRTAASPFVRQALRVAAHLATLDSTMLINISRTEIT